MYSKLQDGNFIISGYVARNAEEKTTQSGKHLTRWSVAVGRKQTANGNAETIWTTCQAWGDTARAAASIRKGDTVLCVGRLEKNEYDGKTYKNLVVEFFVKMSAPCAAQTVASDSISAEDDLSEFEELDTGDLPF